MKVALFVTTKSDSKGLSYDVFLHRTESIAHLTADYQKEIEACGGVDEFFDAVNSGTFGYIEQMEINEISFDLRSLIAAADVEQNQQSTKKPYLFSIKETIDGFESTEVQLAYTSSPNDTAKEIVLRQRGNEPEDWCDDFNGVEFNGGDRVTCSKFQAITYAQAFLWEAADKLRYLPTGDTKNDN